MNRASKSVVSTSLAHDLKALGRVVLAEERSKRSAEGAQRYVALRQADYLTRKILTDKGPGWASGARAKRQARRMLIALKTQLDGEERDMATASLFADSVLHDVEWGDGIKRSLACSE